MEITEKIIKETTKCVKNFECLKNENHTCITSKGIRSIDSKLLFVECNDGPCNYKLNFGYSKICNCPVRIEIFDKYNK
jgi:hypothetical protein